MNWTDYLNAFLSRINFVALCGAVLLFFLPWTDVRCSGTSIATQSGLQAIYGGASRSNELGGEDGPSRPRPGANGEESPKDDVGVGLIICLAFLLVLGGAAAAGLILFKRMSPPVRPEVLAGGALVLLLFQVMIGFPLDRSVSRARQEAAGKGRDAIGMPIPIASHRVGWFYMELLLLAVPTALYVNSRYPVSKWLPVPPATAGTPPAGPPPAGSASSPLAAPPINDSTPQS